VNRVRYKILIRDGVQVGRHSQAVKARMIAVVLLGLTGVTTPGTISAPSTPAVIAAAPNASDSSTTTRSRTPGAQDPSRMLLVGAALIAVAAAVRRGNADSA